MDDRSRDLPILRGRLNIYTMETGDGREIELSVVDEYLCWRRVNDIAWVQLAPLSAFIPSKGKDYWTEEDQREILEYVESKIGNNVSHTNLLGIDQPDQHPIDSITNLRSELDNKVNRVANPIGGNLLAVDSEGNLEDSGVKSSDIVTQEDIRVNYATKSELSEQSKYYESTYATKDDLQSHTSSSDMKYVTKEELTSYSTKEDLLDYTPLEKFDNYRDTVSETYSTKEELDDHIHKAVETLATKDDLKSLVTEDSLGMYTPKIEFLQYLDYASASLATREELADYATKEDLNNLDIETSSLESFRVNGLEVPIIDKSVDITVPTIPEDVGAAPAIHNHEEYVQTGSLFSEDGIILPALLPSTSGNIVEVKTYQDLPTVGNAKILYIVEDENRTYRWSGSRYVPLDQDDTLALGETEDTAFRGDHGKVAYEHALEDHAPPTAQENIIEIFKVNGVPVPVSEKSVNLPIASSEYLGVVRSSNEPDKIRVNEDGTMSLNQVSFSNLITTDEEILLSSGGAL